MASQARHLIIPSVGAADFSSSVWHKSKCFWSEKFIIFSWSPEIVPQNDVLNAHHQIVFDHVLVTAQMTVIQSGHFTLIIHFDFLWRRRQNNNILQTLFHLMGSIFVEFHRFQCRKHHGTIFAHVRTIRFAVFRFRFHLLMFQSIVLVQGNLQRKQFATIGTEVVCTLVSMFSKFVFDCLRYGNEYCATPFAFDQIGWRIFGR